MSSPGEITELLDGLGNHSAVDRRAILDRLIPLLYADLKTLATSNRYRWRGREGLGTTSLVHEAYAKLAIHSAGRFESRKQFYALASRAMRNLLIDSARSQERVKRGNGVEAVDFPLDLLTAPERSQELLELDDALSALETANPDLARIVECRCFGGLTVEQTAEALGVSPTTIKRRWALARAWLYRYLAPTRPTAAVPLSGEIELARRD